MEKKGTTEERGQKGHAFFAPFVAEIYPANGERGEKGSLEKASAVVTHARAETV